MNELGIDIETYSSCDLPSCGVYKYSEAPDFRVLLFSYSVDGGAVRSVDIEQGEALPDDVRAALTDPAVEKTAFNAQFERVCLSRWLGLDGFLDPAQWRCTMARAARMGLPLSLGQCAEVLHLSEGKMKEGAALIRFFSVPGKNGRHRPQDAPDKWETFKAYNIRDVEVEQAVLKKVRRLEMPDWENELYVADQEINDRGVRIDPIFVANAARFDADYRSEQLERLKALTGLENPNSPAQLKRWLTDTTRLPVDTLNKKSLDDLEAKLIYWPTAQEALRLRRVLGKTSNKKYDAMLECVCQDGRIHGLLQYYGANRTGRWAGRLVQVQNLPQNHLPDIGHARQLVRAGDLEDFELEYDNVTQTLSELIRTSFIASEGRTLHVCDFSAIEARVVAWLAGEKWVLDVFRQGGDIYCATASQMFGVPVEKHGKNAELRQKGKIAVLALGYGGGVAALEAMGGSLLGLTEVEERDIVYKWRDANPRIVRLWAKLEEAAMTALRTGRTITVHRGITLERRWGMLLVTLPSGRTLCYPRARVGVEAGDGRRGDHDIIEYEGLNQTTKKWETVRTYGGKMTENLVQSIARDILAHVLLQARRRGMDVVFHVHDEVIIDARPSIRLEDVEALFSDPPTWCRDLPLKGAGYSTPYYLKD